jgi:hypothetical protein
MHFGTKSYLKSTRNHTAKHALTPIFVFTILNLMWIIEVQELFIIIVKKNYTSS